MALQNLLGFSHKNAGYLVWHLGVLVFRKAAMHTRWGERERSLGWNLFVDTTTSNQPQNKKEKNDVKRGRKTELMVVSSCRYQIGWTSCLIA